MSTTKAEILALAQWIGCSLGDADELDRLFTEVLIDLGNDPRAWLSMVATRSTGTATDTTDTARWQLTPAAFSDLVKILAVFQDGRQLSYIARRELEAHNPHWRDDTGVTVCFTTEGEDDRTIRLYPKRTTPTVTSPTMDLIQGAAVVLYTRVTTDQIPDVLALPIALLILAREFSRESNHRDMPFADACGKIAARLLDQVQ